MEKKLSELLQYIGNTPLQRCSCNDFNNIYAKLEYANFTGSVKDRAAFNILRNAIVRRDVHQHSTVIESSSGNMAISLSILCQKLGLRFIAVIDKNINPAYENVLNKIASRVIKVDVQDRTGGYLLSRIETVKQICESDKNVFWTNQYENHDNYMAYYNTLGQEICDAFPSLDFAFISVSSGGTVTGTSLKLKEKFPKIRVVGVDVEGSMIFQSIPQKRYLSGIGSSMRSPIMDKAKIDDVILVSQENIVVGAQQLLKEQGLFCGASSGACYYAIKRFIDRGQLDKRSNAVFICPDRGYAYSDNVYNESWLSKHFNREVVV